MLPILDNIYKIDFHQQALGVNQKYEEIINYINNLNTETSPWFKKLDSVDINTVIVFLLTHYSKRHEYLLTPVTKEKSFIIQNLNNNQINLIKKLLFQENSKMSATIKQAMVRIYNINFVNQIKNIITTSRSSYDQCVVDYLPNFKHLSADDTLKLIKTALKHNNYDFVITLLNHNLLSDEDKNTIKKQLNQHKATITERFKSLPKFNQEQPTLKAFKSELTKLLKLDSDPPLKTFKTRVSTLLKGPQKEALFMNNTIMNYLCRPNFELDNIGELILDDWEKILSQQLNIPFRGNSSFYHSGTLSDYATAKIQQLNNEQPSQSNFFHQFIIKKDLYRLITTINYTAALSTPEHAPIQFIFGEVINDNHTYASISIIDNKIHKVKALILINSWEDHKYAEDQLNKFSLQFKDEPAQPLIVDASLPIQLYKNDYNCALYTHKLLSTLKTLLNQNGTLRIALASLSNTKESRQHWNTEVKICLTNEIKGQLPEFFNKIKDYIPKGQKSKLQWAIKYRWDEGNIYLKLMVQAIINRKYHQAKQFKVLTNALGISLIENPILLKQLEQACPQFKVAPCQLPSNLIPLLINPAPSTSVKIKIDSNINALKQDKLKQINSGATLSLKQLNQLKIRPIFKEKECVGLVVTLNKQKCYLDLITHSVECTLLVRIQSNKFFQQLEAECLKLSFFENRLLAGLIKQFIEISKITTLLTSQKKQRSYGMFKNNLPKLFTNFRTYPTVILHPFRQDTIDAKKLATQLLNHNKNPIEQHKILTTEYQKIRGEPKKYKLTGEYALRIKYALECLDTEVLQSQSNAEAPVSYQNLY